MKHAKLLSVGALSLGLLGALFADAIIPSKADSWVGLFDGSSLDHWQTGGGKAVAKGWVIEKDGTLFRKDRVGDIFSKEVYGDFELEFQFKVAKGSNSGVKYRFGDYSGKRIGCEFQVLDDAVHPDGKNGPDRHTGALYDVIPPNSQKVLMPVGEYNQGRVVALGTKIQHWLNGKLVVDVDLDSDAWKEGHQNSKFKGAPEFARHAGRIMLQDHNDPVWFRNIRIRKLTP